MDTIKFKELEIKQEGTWIAKTLKSRHFRKTIIFIAGGALAGLLVFYLTEGKHIVDMSFGDIFQGMLVGGFIGFFITNSPCARNKC